MGQSEFVTLCGQEQGNLNWLGTKKDADSPTCVINAVSRLPGKWD
jgi:hypothetical protein